MKGAAGSEFLPNFSRSSVDFSYIRGFLRNMNILKMKQLRLSFSYRPHFCKNKKYRLKN